MTYIRHRARMVEQAVIHDITDTLIACRWMSGTTELLVVDPADRGAGYQQLMVDSSDILPIVGKRDDGAVAEVVLVDYFPEASGYDDRKDADRKTELNTFALDHGLAGEPTYLEMGSNAMEQPYVFTMALYASSDAVASAVMNDLQDRYLGRIVRGDWIDLFDRNDALPAPGDDPMVRMGVDAFRHQQSAEQATPWDVNIWYAELHITDEIDAQDPT